MFKFKSLLAAALIGMPCLAIPAHADVCQEDQSCWNCLEMGNMQCGPVIDHGLTHGALPGPPPGEPFLVCQPTQRDGQVFLDQCDWWQG